MDSFGEREYWSFRPKRSSHNIKQCAQLLKCFLPNTLWLCFTVVRGMTFPEQMRKELRKSLSRQGLVLRPNYDMNCIFCDFTFPMPKNDFEKVDPDEVRHVHLNHNPHCASFNFMLRRRNNIDGNFKLAAWKLHRFYNSPNIPCATYKELHDEQIRLATFACSTNSSIQAFKRQYAKNGFFLLCNNMLQCYYCGGIIYNFHTSCNEIPALHILYYPNCMHAQLFTPQSCMSQVAQKHSALEEMFGARLEVKVEELIRKDVAYRMGVRASSLWNVHTLNLSVGHFNNLILTYEDEDIEERGDGEKQEQQQEKQLQPLASDIDDNNGGKCIICLNNKLEVVFLPCKHMVCCKLCVLRLVTKECIACRSEIYSVVDVIFA
nr:apoptosis inhibitor [Menippe mercenaria nudivirus]